MPKKKLIKLQKTNAKLAKEMLQKEREMYRRMSTKNPFP